MNPPTPTPLASTAMEAAREIDREADFGGKLTPTNAVTEISAIIQKHFQPLLAKVEGEKAAKDHVPFSNAELVAQVLALRADLAAAKQERDASMEILDTVARGFERALARVLAWDRFGAENELKLAIAHVDNPHSYTGKSMAQLRADLAAKEAALGGLTASLKEAHAFINAVGTEDPDDVETMAAIEQLSGRITAALASRADKGGAT